MKRFASLFTLLVALAGAQHISAQNTITIHIGTQTSTFILPTNTTSLKCQNPDGSLPQAGASIVLLPGQSSTCTLTLDSPAPAGGFAVAPYAADSPLVLAPVSLTVPANAMTVQFTVTRPAPPAPAAGGGGPAAVAVARARPGAQR
jgi:hypothetical protein